MKVSTKGVAFIADHEGVVTKAYLDPAGIWTIGIGFTMRSAEFAKYWRASRGHDLRRGDTMTRQECFEVFGTLLDKEYGAAVAKKFGDKLLQYQHDACASVVYNCGAGTLSDRWATALAGGNVVQAASLLKSTRVTAGGKRLQGLVNRRAAEARLLQYGEYGTSQVPDRTEMIIEAQTMLAKLGYDVGPADGIAGDKTRAATLAFQKEYVDLVDDGVIGPATLATLKRASAPVLVPATPPPFYVDPKKPPYYEVPPDTFDPEPTPLPLMIGSAFVGVIGLAIILFAALS